MMDWATAWSILGVVAIVIGACVELYRTRTPRGWWYDLDKRMSLVELQMDDMQERLQFLEREVRPRKR